MKKNPFSLASGEDGRTQRKWNIASNKWIIEFHGRIQWNESGRSLSWIWCAKSEIAYFLSVVRHVVYYLHKWKKVLRHDSRSERKPRLPEIIFMGGEIFFSLWKQIHCFVSAKFTLRLNVVILPSTDANHIRVTGEKKIFFCRVENGSYTWMHRFCVRHPPNDGKRI